MKKFFDMVLIASLVCGCATRVDISNEGNNVQLTEIAIRSIRNKGRGEEITGEIQTLLGNGRKVSSPSVGDVKIDSIAWMIKNNPPNGYEWLPVVFESHSSYHEGVVIACRQVGDDQWEYGGEIE